MARQVLPATGCGLQPLFAENPRWGHLVLEAGKGDEAIGWRPGGPQRGHVGLDWVDLGGGEDDDAPAASGRADEQGLGSQGRGRESGGGLGQAMLGSRQKRHEVAGNAVAVGPATGEQRGMADRRLGGKGGQHVLGAHSFGGHAGHGRQPAFAEEPVHDPVGACVPRDEDDPPVLPRLGGRSCQRQDETGQCRQPAGPGHSAHARW